MDENNVIVLGIITLLTIYTFVGLVVRLGVELSTLLKTL